MSDGNANPPIYDNPWSLPPLPKPWTGILHTTEDEARELLVRALKHPFLTDYGMGMPKSEFAKFDPENVMDPIEMSRVALATRLAAIAASADWIKQQPLGNAFSEQNDSSTLASSVEAWVRNARGHYLHVTNGAFLAAAIGLGIEYRQSMRDAGNLLFNLVEGAPLGTLN
jgi:hypothetical protein